MFPPMRGIIVSLAAATVSLSAVAIAGFPAFAQHEGMHKGGHDNGPPTYKIGDLVVTAPWARATPKGAPVAGGYLRITNTGSAPDRLIGGTFPDANRVEVHTMTMEDGVMRMRPLDQGLEIKPGQTVELKPGGLHLMFMGFNGQLKAGTQAKGTLTFDKAGSVDVTYQIAPLGAPGPKMHH